MMDTMPNARRLFYIIGRAINCDDDVQALALLRAARYVFDAASDDVTRGGDALISHATQAPVFNGALQ